LPVKSTFQQAIRSKDFVLTAELRLVEDTGRRGVIEQARHLSAVVDAVTVPANPHGTVHMAGLAAASLLLANDIDPVLHITSRDRNGIAIRSELLGAVAIGVTSLILRRGDRLSRRPGAKPNKHKKVGSVKLLRAAKRLSDYRRQFQEPELCLGTSANVLKPASDWEPAILVAKADAGARFVLTKACLDVEKLRQYLAALVAARITHRCQMIISVPVPHTAEAARMLNEQMRNEAIPAGIVKRLAQASSPAQLGVEIAAEFLRELSDVPGVCGANLIATGDIEMVPAVIEGARARSGF
jgi:methylenetetrahydrofolate reductase (NADPH)